MHLRCMGSGGTGRETLKTVKLAGILVTAGAVPWLLKKLSFSQLLASLSVLGVGITYEILCPQPPDSPVF